MTEPTPLSAEEEAAIRRNVAAMRTAEWGDDPGTAYHPDEQCVSERQLVRLLEAFDAARATVPAAEHIGCPFNHEHRYPECYDDAAREEHR